jgi:hypothetical protein
MAEMSSKFRKQKEASLTRLHTSLMLCNLKPTNFFKTVEFSSYLQNRSTVSMFSGFCSGVVEVSILLGYNNAALGNCVPTFQDDIVALKC